MNWRPSWTADSRSLAYLSNMAGRGGQDDYDVYRMPIDGSAPPALLLHHIFGLWEAELSRDGEWLIVRSDEEGSIGHLRARRLRGDTALIPIVIAKDNSNQAALSPDGHWLAYTILTEWAAGHLRHLIPRSRPRPRSCPATAGRNRAGRTAAGSCSSRGHGR